MEICKMLHVTPRKLGILREEDPKGIYFIERYIAWETEEKIKAHKEIERKSKMKRGRRR